ncbi:hypothetical protein AJ80_09505, partial [Polytolypa hystricis UAMH7299]
MSAKNAHLRESSAHHICPVCPVCPRNPDFESTNELEKHLVKSHHLCIDCKIYHDSAEELLFHEIDIHNLCEKCGEYFSNKNNLQMHQQKHQPRALKYYGYGCEQTFKSLSGILIHLESGYCESGMTEDKKGLLGRFQPRQEPGGLVEYRMSRRGEITGWANPDIGLRGPVNEFLVTTAYKRKADKVQPVNLGVSDGSKPEGGEEWVSRCLERYHPDYDTRPGLGLPYE